MNYKIIKVLFLFPLCLGITLIIDFFVNLKIINLNQLIVNFKPYDNNITCLGCCSLKCLEFALLDTINFKISLPFYTFGITIFYVIIFIIFNNMFWNDKEIKKDIK